MPPLKSLQIFCSGDPSAPLRCWSYWLVQIIVGWMKLVDRVALGVPRARYLLCKSKHLFLLLLLILYVKQRVVLVAIREDWRKRAIR